MKKYVSLILIIFSFSCLYEGNGVDFFIVNSSEYSLTKVKFYTSEKVKFAEFDRLNSEGTLSGWLSMKKNEIDGNYILEFKRHNGKIETYSGGYYTLGRSLNRRIDIEIKNDTVLFK